MYQQVGMITNVLRMKLPLHRGAHGQTFTRLVDCFTL